MENSSDQVPGSESESDQAGENNQPRQNKLYIYYYVTNTVGTYLRYLGSRPNNNM